jgi:hypothetical protein
MGDVVDDHGEDESGCDVVMCWFVVGFSGEREDLLIHELCTSRKEKQCAIICAISFGVSFGAIFLIGSL